MTFIDIHSHLDLMKDLDSVIENASVKNVRIVTASTTKKSIGKTLEISKKYENVFCTLGLYPIDALKLSDSEVDQAIELIREKKNSIAGIGEVGLDLKHSYELEKQKTNLKKFIELAKELNKPLIVHSRRAEKEAIEYLESFNYNKIIMHCFSGNFKLVNRIIENGWFFSIPTSVKSSEHFQKVIEITPLEQLFCETDSPYLHPDRKFPNEPSNVLESYKKIAEIKNISLEKVEKRIEENYKNLFE